MEILSIRRGFEFDHSSTNYEFFSYDRTLTDKERKKVSKYSSRSRPGTRRARFQYHGDWAELPYGAEEVLLTDYYDILVNESYDWWHFTLAFDHKEELFSKLSRYECEGPDDTGIVVEKRRDRILLHLYCMIHYDDFSPASFPTGVTEEETDRSMVDVDFENYINLFVNLKKEILKGDLSSLHAVVDFYEPGKIKGEVAYTKVGKKLKSILYMT